MNSRQKDSALGVLIADAAALSLHWLYDLERLHQVVGTAKPTFFTPNAEHYEGKVGYFAHSGKQAGEQSHYGESYLLNLGHLSKQGAFDTRAFQQDFISVFGAGGTFNGYIDSPTKTTLQHLQEIDFSSEEDPNAKPSGADDHQVPALTPVSALCASCPADAVSDAVIERAIRVTHNNELAVNCGLYFSKILQATLSGKSIADSFASAAAHVPDAIKDKMNDALNMPATDLDSAATLFGQVCGLEETIPLSAYILSNSTSYPQAIEMNILAGGDSCGRAMMLGALAGAYYGLGGAEGIPHSWLLSLKRQQDIAALLM
jgi:ADP-ribosylglycohydrolase